MKKLYIILFAIIILHIQTKAQWQPTYGSIGYDTINCIVANGSTVFALTGDGSIFRSTDNGSTWTASNNGLSDYYVTTLFIDGSNIFAGTAINGIYLSTDNGSSWVAKNTGLTATNNEYGYVGNFCKAGSNIFARIGSFVYLSSNNGLSWIQKSSGLGTYGLVELGSNGIYLYGISGPGNFYKSVDYGNNWFEDYHSGGITMYYSILRANGNNIYAGGFNVPLILSTDTGYYWNSIGETSSQDIKSMLLYNSKLYVGAANYLSFRDATSGVWSSVKTGLPSGYEISALATCGSYMYAGTNGKGVYKRLLTEVIGIEESTIQNLEIYPSIASNSITIEIQPNNIQNDFIAIYNMEGQLISQQPINQAKTEIDISNLSKGIYFIKHTSKNITTTRKFIKE